MTRESSGAPVECRLSGVRGCRNARSDRQQVSAGLLAFGQLFLRVDKWYHVLQHPDLLDIVPAPQPPPRDIAVMRFAVDMTTSLALGAANGLTLTPGQDAVRLGAPLHCLWRSCT